MTISAWVYPTSMPSHHTVLAKGPWGFGLHPNGVFGFGYGCSSGQVGSYSPANAVPLNQWTHLAATWDGSLTSAAVILYVNGASIYAYPQGCTGPLASDASYAVTLGASDWGANFVFGKIDSVRVYNRVLSASEIGTLYTQR
jgi:hypothetical protein